MTIIPEERAAWRILSQEDNGKSRVSWAHARILRLLDALEAAEACVEQVEAERDVLVEEFVAHWDCPAMSEGYYAKGWDCETCKGKDSKPCWLAWARQEARKHTSGARP